MEDNVSASDGATARAQDDASSQANWKRIYLATGALLLAIEAILVYYGAALTTPLVLLILVIVFARPGQKLRFVRDFGPFLLVLFAYYSMWGSADDIGGAIHVTPQIDAERFLFRGHIPTVVLQNALYDPNHPHWYDYAAVIGHLSHFIVPILFAAIVWQHHGHLHLRFMSSYVLLSYAAFLTFMLVPSAPPWWAGEHGYIDKVYLVHETVPGLSRIYSDLSANPVAAIPSLHAAFPWLLFLFSLKIWGRRALPVVLYPVFIWWSIVYSGHHYVVDAIAGTGYATATFYALSGHPYNVIVGMFRRLRPRQAPVEAEGSAAQRPAIPSTTR
ncbi:MAG: phosphatase PAP2 family protein [Dehalococcoidia bacterium]